MAKPHVGLLTSLAVATFAGLRVLSVTDFHVPTAVGLANAAGLSTVVFATAITLAALVPSALALIAVWIIKRAVRKKEIARSWFWCVCGTSVLGYFLLSLDMLLFWVTIPILLALDAIRIARPHRASEIRLISAIVIIVNLVGPAALGYRAQFLWLGIAGAAAFLVLAMVDWGDRYDKTPEPLDFQFSIYLLVFVALSLFGSFPWLPLETMATQERDAVGYVVEDEGRWITFLDESPRRIRQIDASLVSSRVACSMDESGIALTANQLLTRTVPTQLPACPGLAGP